ncbi:hypothetical protein SAMN02800692_0924 [Luteibacter sp. UNC138MFCol5.1]|uniref:hypothetical protein n=1 Tax=Luteibacter sp. UNC138MFCol5.1 TaxID=1502774 RepID=UPI0008BF46A8|nr:hypothetical protein [Luteibacter sp. UNC138MFCol5.1]SEO46682.1 hypothetical protein SAMN02800692_0924 [Luteibacter sp. UNC138MFCol5.1]
MAAIKKDTKRSGYFAATKNSYARFDGSGMSVDVESFLRTEDGRRRFRELTKSAFGSKAKTPVSKAKK